jgi:hypothetical protein
LRFAAQNEDGTTFFPQSLAAAGIALFLPLALADNPWLNIPWKRVVLTTVKILAILLGFAGLAVWASLVRWSIDPL